MALVLRTPNQNDHVTDEMWWLWLELETLIGSDAEFSGIYARKPGYHNTRAGNSPSNYSVAQFAADRQGPSNKAAALDISFRSAKNGDFRKIALYSKRLLDAGRSNDPRTYGMREFYGNADLDREVEGYDFARRRVASSDDSHLWHIHISILRKYVGDIKAMRAIVSIMRGESVATWRAKEDALNPGKPVEVPKPRPPALPVVRLGSRLMKLTKPYMEGTDVATVQRFIGGPAGTVDGVYGPKTEDGVKWYQRLRGITADGIVGPQTLREMGLIK